MISLLLIITETPQNYQKIIKIKPNNNFNNALQIKSKNHAVKKKFKIKKKKFMCNAIQTDTKRGEKKIFSAIVRLVGRVTCYVNEDCRLGAGIKISFLPSFQIKNGLKSLAFVIKK